MPKMTVRVILKSGVEFSIKCDKFTLTRNGFQQVTGYNIEGITENKPVYLDFEQVAAVVRVFADKKPETDDTPEEKRLFTETPMQCPFCEGENSNARVYISIHAPLAGCDSKSAQKNAALLRKRYKYKLFVCKKCTSGDLTGAYSSKNTLYSGANCSENPCALSVRTHRISGPSTSNPGLMPKCSILERYFSPR